MAVAIAALAIGAAALTGLSIQASGGGLAADIALSRAALELDQGVAAAVFKAVGLAAGLPVWLVVVATISVIVERFRPRRSRELIGILVLTEIATLSLKLLVDRPRPVGSDAVEMLVSAGFPSGHVARTAVACTFVITLLSVRRRVRVGLGLAALAVVVITGLARVASGAHYVTDVLGGTLLAASVLALWQLIHELRSAWSTRELEGTDDAETPAAATR